VNSSIDYVVNLMDLRDTFLYMLATVLCVLETVIFTLPTAPMMLNARMVLMEFMCNVVGVW